MSPALVAGSPESMNSANDSVENQYEKGVKYLYESGIRSIPLKYILPVSERPDTVQGEPYITDGNLQLPVIDFSELQGPKRSQVLRSLASACENYGFFQVGNSKIRMIFESLTLILKSNNPV